MPTKEEIRKFSEFIAEFAEKRKLSIFDAIVAHCQEEDFEIELAAKLLSNNLKAMVAEEAESLNLLKAKNRRLPTL